MLRKLVQSRKYFTLDALKISVSEQPQKHETLITEEDLPSLYEKLSPVQTQDLTNSRSTVLYTKETLYSRNILLLPPKEKPTSQESLQSLAGSTLKLVKSHKITHFDLALPFQSEFNNFYMNALLAQTYQFSLKQKKEDNEEYKDFIQNINITPQNSLQNFNKNLSTSKITASHLANQRANVATPQYFRDLVQKTFASHPQVKVTITEGPIVEQEFPLLYAVGKGSANKPLLIHLEYHNGGDKRMSWIGKGMTFDAGGLNIKPTGSMEDMFMDKAGACAVLSAFKSVVDMGLKVNLSATCAFAENFLGEMAYRPSDIIESRKGLSVEIGNTDAEGRLILADAMSYNQEVFKPHSMMELSTLTGACMIALGNESAGLFSNDDELSKELTQIGEKVNEPLWRLPITKEHRKGMEGKFSDLSNSGKGYSIYIRRYGGASKAAAFLERFVEQDVKWAHIDIAGPALRDDKSATGFGAQLLLQYAIENQEK